MAKMLKMASMSVLVGRGSGISASIKGGDGGSGLNIISFPAPLLIITVELPLLRLTATTLARLILGSVVF